MVGAEVLSVRACMENISGTCWSTTVLRVYIQQGKPSRHPLGCEGPKLNVASKSVYLQRPCLTLLCSVRLLQKMKPLGNWKLRISALPEKVVTREYVFQALKLKQ